MLPEFGKYGPRRSYPCAICGQSATSAIQANAHATRWDLYHQHFLYANKPCPPYRWLCTSHQRYRIRAVTACATNELGDAVYTLACGHEALTLLRYSLMAYPPGIVMTFEAGSKKRCYLCAETAHV
jgi:hypothetical protein